MVDAAPESRDRMGHPRRATSLRWSFALAALAVLAIVLWGGYGRHWAWTGINGKTATLWDWLHLLLLPIAVGILPLWLSHRTRVATGPKLLGLSLLVAFAVVVLAGYIIPWAWTGFVGNKLWDWLELLVLPLAVALTPVLLELRDRWTVRHSLVALTALAAFVVVVLGGYLGNWGWTGFRGNTFWNWLHLWLLPLLIPILVLLMSQRPAMSGVIMLDEDGQAQTHGESLGTAARTSAE
ncbi:MAG: hypothetical protein JO321_05545 [Solirubrobacterales bacterium]|nr:hypothetical protein [Solirubrobacterales bacterium]